MGLSPVSISVTLVLGVVLLAVPRRWSPLPFLVIAVFIPPDQSLAVGPADFNMLRVMVVFGFARLIFRGEIRALRLQALDVFLIAFIVVSVVAYTILWGTTGAFINRLGRAFDAVGTYFFFRMVLRSWKDVQTLIVGAGASAVLLAVFMVFERITARNLFSLIGGVPEVTVIRDGRLRCQGAFSHPIMAGLYGAVWLPLFVGLWWQGRRQLAGVFIFASLLVVVCSASSTPVLSVVLGLLAIGLWWIRAYMAWVRWGSLAILVVLHFVREQPVWHLLARINVVGGSTGWHRYHLIDQAIEHFYEWWLIGTQDTSHWGYFLGDVTNEYVLAGVRGGLLAMLLLIAMIWAGFRAIGKGRRRGPPAQRRFVWTLGAMLFVHASSFIAVSYFGQMRTVWFIQLALITSVVTLPSRRPARVRPG